MGNHFGAAARRMRRRRAARVPVGLACGLLVLAGCTAGGGPAAGEVDASVMPSPSPSPSPTARVPDPGAVPPVPEVVVEFEYEVPDEPCSPASALSLLPLAEAHRYAVRDEFFDDDHRVRIRSWCTYRRADLADVEHDMALEDHVMVHATITLFQHRSDSDWAAVYPDLPLASTSLDDWAVASAFRREIVPWREGCEPDLVCAEGETPTVQTSAWQTRFEGFVGNLEFYVAVTYIAEDLPPDVQARNVAIFRELVLAEVDRRTKRDPE